MCKVKVDRVDEGLIASEKVVTLKTTGGEEEFPVQASKVTDKVVSSAALICEGQDNTVLIEMPRESASGRRRVWVQRSQLG